MVHRDAVVLGAGIVGTAIALHLAKRGLAVALIDRRGPGEGTSYGNAGVIGGAGVYPTAFPRRLGKLLRIALKRAPEANYHLSFLPRIAPWLLRYYRASTPKALEDSARKARPLMACAVAEHEALLAECGASEYMRKNGWITVHRRDEAAAEREAELELGAELGIRARRLSSEETLALEPSLRPVFRCAIYWPDVASLANPLGVTRAYAARFSAIGGAFLQGDARSLRRANGRWRVETANGPLDAAEAVVALGPWAPDVLVPLGLRLPLAIKRGYHRHFATHGNADLTRPVLDAERGYVLAPMQQGIRLTTGAEFAACDAPPTPVQLARVLPWATELLPLGAAVEPQPWLGCRPVFPDSLPVIGQAPRLPGLWLAIGHGHWGMSLGPVTGRLMAEMLTGADSFCDPAPYAAERFL